MRRFVKRRRKEFGREMRRLVRRNAPVDTGLMRGTIGSIGSRELFRIDDKVWLYNEIGVPHPGNLLNRDWMSSAIRAACLKNGAVWPSGTVLR